MVASKRFPLKTLLLSAGMSTSLALLGCATNGLPSSTTSGQAPLTGSGQQASQPTSSTSQATQSSQVAQSPQAGPYRYDWSSDRMGIAPASSGFRTASFIDSIKPSLDLPAVDRQTRDASTSGGLINTFAKDLPGANDLAYVPNTPAVIGTNTFFLTGSSSSVNAFSLGSNGQMRWELNLHENGKFLGSSPAIGQAFSNVIFAVTDTGRLYAINADSGLVISFVDIVEEEFQFSSPFVSRDGGTDAVYVASYKGRVYRYNFNGSSFTQAFNVRPVTSSNTGRFASSPLVTTNGGASPRHIYVGSLEGKLYKLNAATGATISAPLELNSALRSTGCQIMSTMAVDVNQDIGVIPCGSYLFKVRLNDASTTTAPALNAQSPLLEHKQLVTLKTTRVLGPNHNVRPQLTTTVLREPKPTGQSIKLEQNFGFKTGDFIRVESTTSGNIYTEIDTIPDDGALTVKGDGLYPVASPSPDPLLFGGELVHLANHVVRPPRVPEPQATPYPTPTPGPAGSDPVTRFPVGQPENLQAGDYLRFPTLDSNTSLPGIQPVVAQICSSTNTDCELTTTTKYTGIERFVPGAAADGTGGQEDEAAFYVTVPGTALQTQIATEMANTRYVPFEKLTHQIVGTANSTQEFEIASIKDFKAGDTVRITHQDGNSRGRYEYGVIDTVFPATRRIRLIGSLLDAPVSGDNVDIIDSNNRAFGRVTSSLGYSNGNILSEPVLRGNGQHVYVQHGNTVYELNYGNDTSFKDSANYLILQAGRLEQNNTTLNALSRSRPMIDTDKLLTVDSDPSGKTGIFMNRVLLPLSSTSERLNDLFPILAPNSLGQLPSRAETRPVQLGASGYVMFGGGNGVAYKLHKDIAW